MENSDFIHVPFSEDELRRVRDLGIATPGFVYFLHDREMHPDLIKIGYTKNLRSRLQQYKTSLPLPQYVAVVPGDFTLEKTLHHLLRDKKGKFREWFVLNWDEISVLLDQKYAPVCEQLGGPFGWFPIRYGFRQLAFKKS